MRTSPLLVSIGLVLAACGSEAAPAATSPPDETPVPPESVPTSPPVTDPDDRGGFGSQAATADDFDVTFRAALSGRLEQDERGCWSLAANGEDAFVVLPVGFEDAPDGGAVVAPDGSVIAAGTAVDTKGAIMSIDGLPGGTDGRLATLAAFCRPGARTVVVTDAITADDFDPTTLDDTALAAFVTGADLDVDWPCGFGFATSSADERVGLFLDPTVFEPPPAGTFMLPDDRWRAVVVVGEHLFVNHCDDVAEWFEPDRVVGATYPLVAGTFEFAPPAPDAGSDEPVTIVLDGGVVDGPTGLIELGPITITNEAYGFLAG